MDWNSTNRAVPDTWNLLIAAEHLYFMASIVKPGDDVLA
jgi:hypothetical protein